MNSSYFLGFLIWWARAWTKRGGDLAKEVLGHEAGPYALSLNNLAGLLKAQGDYDKARPLYERTLAIFEKALGLEHPDVARSLNHLARLDWRTLEKVLAKPVGSIKDEENDVLTHNS